MNLGSYLTIKKINNKYNCTYFVHNHFYNKRNLKLYIINCSVFNNNTLKTHSISKIIENIIC